MAEKTIEQQEVQQNPGAEQTVEKQDEVIIEEEVVVEDSSDVDIDEIKKRAEVSSQNFERAKKAEEENKELRARLQEYDVDSNILEDDEDTELRDKITALEAGLAERDPKEAFPQLKDAWDDFETFHGEEDNKAMPLKTAAKAFIAEKGLSGTPRKGLEKATGGRGTVNSGMTTDKLTDIRKNDPKKYREMVKKGQIKFS